MDLFDEELESQRRSETFINREVTDHGNDIMKAVTDNMLVVDH